ncbi:MAG: alpha/beta hydrolase [Acidimicrobiales bacterium]
MRDAAAPETCELADGRVLAYDELGDPDGTCVISCHGGLSSRLDVAPAHDAAQRLGIRLIAPDRPGVGGSTIQPGRTLLDWPTDVAALADHLGVDRFAVMGWSLGGQYAMACAAALPQRVSALAVVAGCLPPTWPEMLDELNRMDRKLLGLSENHPRTARSIFHLMHATAEHAPKAMAKQSGVSGDTGRDVTTAIAEGLHDAEGVRIEYEVFGAPWGFEPEDVTVRADVWQGDADDLVPASWGERLAAAMPHATLHAVPGATHFLWYDHWDEILGSLVGSTGPA